MDHEWIEIKEECNEEPIQTTVEQPIQNQERIKRKYTKKTDKLPAIQKPVSSKTYNAIINKRKVKLKNSIKPSIKYNLRSSRLNKENQD